MWDGDERAFHGRRLDLEQPICRPAPLSRPRPRLLIGGTGERRTLPLVARYADACNVFDIPDGGKTVRAKLDALAQACERADRDPAEIETTISTRLDADEPAAALVERCAELGAFGLDHVVLITTGPWTEAHLSTVRDATAVLAPGLGSATSGRTV